MPVPKSSHLQILRRETAGKPSLEYPATICRGVDIESLAGVRQNGEVTPGECFFAPPLILFEIGSQHLRCPHYLSALKIR